MHVAVVLIAVQSFKTDLVSSLTLSKLTVIMLLTATSRTRVKLLAAVISPKLPLLPALPLVSVTSFSPILLNFLGNLLVSLLAQVLEGIRQSTSEFPHTP